MVKFPVCKMFTKVHRNWGLTLRWESLSFWKWHGLYKPWWPVNKGPSCLYFVFPCLFCIFQTTYGKGNSTMNPQTPITWIQQLSRFCHIGSVYPSFYFSFWLKYFKANPVILSFYPCILQYALLKNKKDIFLCSHKTTTTWQNEPWFLGPSGLPSDSPGRFPKLSCFKIFIIFL